MAASTSRLLGCLLLEASRHAVRKLEQAVQVLAVLLDYSQLQLAHHEWTILKVDPLVHRLAISVDPCPNYKFVNKINDYSCF